MSPSWQIATRAWHFKVRPEGRLTRVEKEQPRPLRPGLLKKRGSYGPTVAKYSFARSVVVVCVKNGVNLFPMLSSPT
jgi:hypothetical protein